MRLCHLLSAVLLVPLLASCGASEAEAPEEERGAPPPLVEAVQARYGSLPLEAQLTGTVEAKNQVAIYPQVTAPIAEVYAENGDYVEQGDPLVRLRVPTSQEQIAQAQANLRAARAAALEDKAALEALHAQLERTEQLAEQGYVSEQRLETVRAQVATAEASYAQSQALIEQAQATLEERQATAGLSIVRAPISGWVGQRNAEVGMLVDGTTPLFTIGDLSEVRVEIALTQEMLQEVEVGQTARIRVPTLSDTVVTGTLARVSPFLMEGTYSAEAEIDVPNPGGLLRPGMFVTAEVLYGESRKATLVPNSALYENPDTGRQGVYVAPTLGVEIEPPEPAAPDADEPAPATQPVPLRFQEVEVIAEGRSVSGVRGIEPGAWVAVLGQNLLRLSGETPSARVRPVTWKQIVSLQQLQREDVLRNFLERHQQMTTSFDSTQTS